LISGFRGEADMVRGEETQALGLAAALGDGLPDRAVVILPGTHSTHLTLRAGVITGVTTHLTGELFELLARQSVLRHSTEWAAPWQRAAFVDGVAYGRERSLSAALFRVRTRQVLDRAEAAANTSFLSGLLIGTELAGVAAGPDPVVIATSGALGEAYAVAAEALGFGARFRSVEAGSLSVLGQAMILQRLLAAREPHTPAARE